MGCIVSKLKRESKTMSSQATQSEFQYRDGRRFHNTEGAIYPMPNDEDEQDRLHLQHFLMRYLWQSNFSAPINHILDQQVVAVSHDTIPSRGNAIGTTGAYMRNDDQNQC
ncbi:7001_t:CDS:2 [Racocetra fulgida]|uniref:7001_t:CDS:1 n=1 Tax=Racocetra fulgida TaxID=60492 RepID=A0A9N8ZAJ2_9GLOM|nr:7001_t:CDS:2 [Racocetra fulgida]